MAWPTDPPDLWTLIRTDTYLICWAISEIPRLSPRCSRAALLEVLCPRRTLQNASGIFFILVPNMGRFPELTPVRSQTVESWFATLEAGNNFAIGIPRLRGASTLVVTGEHLN